MDRPDMGEKQRKVHLVHVPLDVWEAMQAIAREQRLHDYEVATHAFRGFLERYQRAHAPRRKRTKAGSNG